MTSKPAAIELGADGRRLAGRKGDDDCGTGHDVDSSAIWWVGSVAVGVVGGDLDAAGRSRR